VKITADTNLMLRAILEDDSAQAAISQALIGQAELIAIPAPVFCEMAWTMRRLYKRQPEEIASALEALLRVESVVTDRPAVEAGIEVLRRGGDFADGVIAWLGMALGATVLATFDRGCVNVLESAGLPAGEPATLLSGKT
jgi:predicted nucleic-acid-binding protein